MRRPRSHQIDHEAMVYLQATLPSSWVVNEQPRDYAKDYLVEIAESGNLTGETFIVQLKGQSKVKLGQYSSCAKFSLKTNHAVYYADKAKLPVFLVLVDVTEKVGYWLFVQQYLLETLETDQWRNKKTITVQVPTTNELTATDRLLQAARKAIEYMAALHPVAIEAALNAERLRWEGLDSRIGVEVSLIRNQKILTLHPKEPIELRVALMGPVESTGKKYDELVNRGISTHFEAWEMTVSGSPLLSQLANSGAMFETQKLSGASVSLTARSNQGDVLARIDHIPAELSGGRTESCYRGQLFGSLLTVQINIERASMVGSVAYNIDTSAWHRKDISSLPYFDEISKFVLCRERACTLDVEGKLNGNFVFRTSLLSEGLVSDLDDVILQIAALAKARKIVGYLKRKPIYCEVLTAEQMSDIDLLYGVCFEEFFVRKVQGWKVSLCLDRSHVEKIVRERSFLEPGSLRICGIEGRKVLFFGETVELGRLDILHTQVTLDQSMESLADALASGDRTVKVSFRCEEDAEQSFQAVSAVT